MSRAAIEGAELSVDEICGGELALQQPRRGYRFNIDAVLLARFAASLVEQAPRCVTDLGAGCGVIGLLLARQWPAAEVTLVELQPLFAELARRNVERNGFGSRARVIEGDLRDVASWASVPQDRAIVVCNPPFFVVGRGRESPRADVALARHELRCTLRELVGACAAGLGRSSALGLIHAAERRDELEACLREHELFPFVMREVRPLPGRPANRVLCGARPGFAGAARELAPLYVHQRPGSYSDEVRQMLRR